MLAHAPAKELEQHDRRRPKPVRPGRFSPATSIQDLTHICAGTGLAPPTSALGLVHPTHIRTGTGTHHRYIEAVQTLKRSGAYDDFVLQNAVNDPRSARVNNKQTNKQNKPAHALPHCA